MLYWAAIYLALAIVAAIFGFSGIAGAAAGIAQLLFFLFCFRSVSAQSLPRCKAGDLCERAIG